jgi:outer membrane protein assembly factor BamB
VTTSERSVYALTTTGKVAWRVAIDDLVLGHPGVGSQVVVVGGAHTVTALSRSDGGFLWSRPSAAAVHSLRVAGGRVLVGDDAGRLTALDTRTGVASWSAQLPGRLWSPARVDGSTGSVAATWHGGDAPALRVFDQATGQLRWEAPTDRYSSAPVIAGGAVVVAVGDGDRHARVEARDLVTGRVRWQTAVPASFEEAIEPAADRMQVAVVDHFGVVSLLDLRTGRLRWQHDLATPVLETRVVLTRRRVVFTSYDGVLHVLRRVDGREVAALTPTELGGAPVAIMPAPTPPRLLVAVRMHDWGVKALGVP